MRHFLLPAAFLLGALGLGAFACAGVHLRPWDAEPDPSAGLVCTDSGRDVLGLAPTQREKLSRIAESGIVAVRYTEHGCNVELELLDCFAEGKYQYTPYASEDHKTAYRSGDLWAQIPLGAARLGSGLHEGEALKKDVMMVGSKALPPEAPIGALKGRECEKANYVVKTLYVGGFAIHRGAREVIDANASFFGAGAGGKLAQGVQRQDGDGDLAACAAASTNGQPSGQCAAPLKIELLSLGRESRREPSPPPAVVAPEVPRPPSPPPPPPPVAVYEPPPAPAPVAQGGMVSIPGGSFLMGADDISDDEKPPHRVTVGAFQIDLTEVTVAAYRRCVEARKCTTAGLTFDNRCNWDKADRADHPINCVDWNQATAYCAFAGKRLATEREWEFAARGSESRKYPWGDAPPSNQLCWDGDGSDLGKGNRRSTCPVGRYRAGASPFGVLDMAGNVWEWTSSSFCKPESNNCTSAARVFRGGGWYDGRPVDMRGASRSRLVPTYRSGDLGLRCAR